jgi:hypothetical protein
MIARWLDAGVKWVAMNEQDPPDVYYSMFARRSDPLRAAGPSGKAFEPRTEPIVTSYWQE